jgi:uncharacterized protein (TIGR02611 family)
MPVSPTNRTDESDGPLDALLDKAEAMAAPDAEAVLRKTSNPLKQVASFVARSGKRIAVAVVGGAVVMAGIAMLVLPGPGFVVIIAGLAILATEFAWARAALDRAKQKAEQAKQLATGGDPTRAKFLQVALICLGVVGVATSVWWYGFR